MRNSFLVCLGGLSALLSACTTVETDRTTLDIPIAIRTQVTFEPLDREKAARYLETERHAFKANTEPMLKEKTALEAGRKERFDEISREFPECGRQRHCTSHLSRGDVKRFERFNDLSKEILEYDRRIVVLEAAIRDWERRLELRSRAILNRFLVHEVLQMPEFEKRFQGVMVYSLESFDTRKQLSYHLLRYGGDANLVPAVLGDFNFRMLGRPIDEAAVIATFEVYLMPLFNEPRAPTRYVVTMLVNTFQLDLRNYDKDFMREWATKMSEPFQEALRQEVYCGMYSIASETILPRLAANKQKRCQDARMKMQALFADKFLDRFTPATWMLPLAYYPMARPISGGY
jgi:hypothetical protein